jgi:hypothetical protein
MIIQISDEESLWLLAMLKALQPYEEDRKGKNPQASRELIHVIKKVRAQIEPSHPQDVEAMHQEYTYNNII